MDASPNQQLQVDSQEIRNAMTQAMSDAIKALPRPQVPSWMEAGFEFIKAHPWLSLSIAFLVIFVITAIIREIICSYLKTNEILARLRAIEEKMKTKQEK